MKFSWSFLELLFHKRGSFIYSPTLLVNTLRDGLRELAQCLTYVAFYMLMDENGLHAHNIVLNVFPKTWSLAMFILSLQALSFFARERAF